MHTQPHQQSSTIVTAPAAAFPEFSQERSEEIASAVAAVFRDQQQCPTYLTVVQFSKRHPAFTAPALRNLIFKANHRDSTLGVISGNGLIQCGAIVRLGRKVLIHEGRFFEWLEKQQLPDRNGVRK
jgi:hypothetical protein